MTSTRAICAEWPIRICANSEVLRPQMHPAGSLGAPRVAQPGPPYFAMNADDGSPAVPNSPESSPARRPLIPPPLDASHPQMAHVAQLERMVQQLQDDIRRSSWSSSTG